MSLGCVRVVVWVKKEGRHMLGGGREPTNTLLKERESEGEGVRESEV